MKIYQLEYFAEVYRQMSISKAAERLFVSQPAVSMCIKELEDEFGIKLFLRAGNKIEPTEAGTYFYARTQTVLDSVDALRKDMYKMSDRTVRIKVGAPPMIGALLFPQLYNELHEAHPDLKLEIFEFGSLQAQSLVALNKADAAIAILNNAVDEALEAFPLFRAELVFCVNRSHPLAQKETVTWEDVEGQDLILMKEDSYQNAMVKERFAQKNIKPNILLYSSQLATIRNFIVNSKAGAFLFKQICDGDPDLKGLPLSDPIYLDIGILWRKNTKLYDDVKDFIAFVEAYVVRNL